ncbi:tRNA pseudouridine(55) synthase TruB [Paludicola sp. MB14-C6]|uniref:tRNA pseudouridine(55) synthase TruB n=1 Tax=Paludihabitans sp. MB14-C6 TaxID=3070656 RepID=UPI0027DB2D36|nr:tRNA pseudouridine(55) synthase TruB [Paludicola sp. MB14-C6]WMJ23013.1 tRNA pseudouridine(55) synthase TruB [Paludicola sp. MB14-C6]
MNGILCINKPQEYTSFDVVARIRGMTKTKRVGHSGTLDPLATGVLPIFIGNATKACDMLPNDDKSYIAEFEFGFKTDTLDISGEVLETFEKKISKEEIIEKLNHFRGDIQQIPPMYSAVRVNGQRLYDIARQGREIEREPRSVTIFKLELMDFDKATQKGKLEIACSKGTYIRSIISDLGELLGTGGTMTALCRDKACGFSLDDCITLEQAQDYTTNGTIEQQLLPVDRLFYHLPKIQLNEIQSIKFKNGVKLDLNRVIYKNIDTLHRVYDNEKVFLGLASLDKEDMALVIEKMFYR